MRSRRFWNNNLFVAVSNKQRDLGKKYFNFVDTIPHGINLKNYTYSENKHYKDALFAGRIIWSKRPDLAIESALKTNTPITLCGDTSKTKKDIEYFKNKVEKHFKNKLVNYSGHIEYNQMSKYYQNAKFLLMPISWHEPFGMVMIEAMACGTPVIGFNMGSVPEIVKDGKTGYVVNHKEGLGGLIKAINKINQLSPEQYINMRRSCRECAEKEYSIEKMVRGYEKLFYKLSRDKG